MTGKRQDKPPVELLEFLSRFDAGVRSMTLGLRTVVLEALAPCHELILSMGEKVSLVYSTSERVIADGICYIGVYRRHVNLGFHRGVDLDDPEGRLRGTGKAMRHVQIKNLSDLDQPELRRFLVQARKNEGRPPGGFPTGVVTRVKRSRAGSNPLDRLFMPLPVRRPR